MTYAKVIADSISPAGIRLTTLEVRMHRFVLAEFNTHRDFSRNSASSRAIPFRKQVERVLEDPAIPASWPAEQRGMQGGDELSDAARDHAQATWLEARDAAVAAATRLHELGVHKSVVNRLLEPFMWHTVIASTRWDNFFEQRCSPLAQPEIRLAAELMRDALNDSSPSYVALEGDRGWHLPYVSKDAAACAIAAERTESIEDYWLMLAKISAARCARVSYLTHDGKRDIDADLALYDKLVSANPPHWSPLEHVATPAMFAPRGNFDGWHQLRHTIPQLARV